MIFLIWMLTILVALLVYFRQIYSKFSKAEVKHFGPIPLFGNLAKVTLQREHFIDNYNRLYNAFPGERFVGSYELTNPVIVIRDLDLIKKITLNDYEYFLDHRSFVDEEVEPFFGKNLFSLRGQKWKDMRSTLSPAFTSSKIRLMVPMMVEVGDQMIKSLNKDIQNSNGGFIDVECRDLLTRYANDVIATCAFGLKVDSLTDRDNQFYKMGKEATNFTIWQVLILFGYGAFPNFMKFLKVKLFTQSVKRFFNDLVTSTMMDREIRNIYRNDMIHLLMEAKKGKLTHTDKNTKDTDAGYATVEESSLGKKEINRVWSDQDLIAQAVLFFISGFDTMSTTMTFLLFELALNPDIQEKLAQEIKQNHSTNGGNLDYNSIQQMTYLDMVISEILRLWPIGLFCDRICTKDYNLGKPNDMAAHDYVMRRGEILAIPMWEIHRNPDYFPDPLKFDPERFSNENKHMIQPFTYFPFGLGPRNCIGSRFALCEVKVMVYQLLMHLEVSCCEKTCIPIQLIPESFTPQIKGGHWLRMKTRNF